MREIKFRAWDKSWWFMTAKVDLKDISNWFIWLHNNIIMQYTWLKDKNWKEIYEGDIVYRDSFVDILRSDTNWTIRLDTKLFYEIIFDKWSFCWKLIKKYIMQNKDMLIDDFNYKKNLYIWDIMSLPNEIIIIWNIYENPNLK